MRGPCAKQRVICTITSPEGDQFIGENDCANPQPACPRLPGEGYAKCKNICQQDGHAEAQAIRNAGPAAAGSTAQLTGHYWICEPCGRALRDAGVRCVTIKYTETIDTE